MLGLGIFFLDKREITCVYQKLQRSIAFPCLLVLLGTFFGYLSLTKDLLVLCPVACPWSVRCQSRTNHCLSLFLSKERWELHWRGCGGKDDIETMQKMWPFWNSCGLGNISNPRSKGRGGGGTHRVMQGCNMSVTSVSLETHFQTVKKGWKKVLPSKYLIRLYSGVCSFNFHILV